MVSIVTPVDSSVGNFTNYTVTWPNTDAGDKAIVVWSRSTSAVITTDVDAVDAGFSKAAADQDDGSERLSVWVKNCSGSESGDMIFSLSGGSRGSVHLVVIRGVGTLEAVVSNADTGTDANHTAPTLSSGSIVTANGVVIVVGGERVSTGSTASTPPSGYTIASEGGTGGSGGNYAHVSYEGSGGTLSGTHAVGVAISPGTWVHNVAASDVAMFSLYFPLSAIVVNPATVSGSVSLAGQTPKASATVTPSVVSGAVAITGHTVKAGQTVTAVVVAGTVSLAGQTPRAGTDISPSTVSGSVSIPSPTNVRAPVTLSPDTVVGKLTTGSADEYWDEERDPYQIRIGYTAPPSTASGSVSIPTPAVVIQQNTANPATVNGSVTIPGNVARAGGVIVGSVVSGSAVLPTVAVSSGAAPTPGTVNGSSAIAAPSVSAGSGTGPSPATVVGTATVSGSAGVGYSVAPATITHTVAIDAPAISISHTHSATTVSGSASVAGHQVKAGTVPAPATIQRTVVISGHTITAGVKASPATVAGIVAIAGTAGIPSPFNLDITVMVGPTRMSVIGPTRRDRNP